MLMERRYKFFGAGQYDSKFGQRLITTTEQTENKSGIQKTTKEKGNVQWNS